MPKTFPWIQKAAQHFILTFVQLVDGTDTSFDLNLDSQSTSIDILAVRPIPVSQLVDFVSGKESQVLCSTIHCKRYQ